MNSGAVAANLTRIDVELIIKSLAGGAYPASGDTIVFSEDGWHFAPMFDAFIVVTNVPYNAVGNGTTDDTAAIQSAINAAASAGGGIVFFPPGTYLVSQLRLKDKVFLWGSGYSTKLTQPNNNHTVVDSGTSSGGNAANTINDTGKSWVVNAFAGYTAKVTGTGEKHMIRYNTATQSVIADPWVSTPGSVAYSILNGKHMFVLDDTGVEFTGIRNMWLYGNKANQLAIVDCIHYINGGSTTLGDSHHLLDDLLIDNFSGCGITRGKACREMRVHTTRINACDEHGTRNLLDSAGAGASDGKFTSVIAAQCGLTGFFVDTGHDQYAACKAFGNGTRNITSYNAGFLITRNGCSFSACEAQENRIGWNIRATFGTTIVGCISDANDTYGLQLENGDHNYIQLLIGSTAGLLYTTDYGFDINSTSDDNVLELDVFSFEIATAFSPGTVLAANNILRMGAFLYGRLYSHINAVGTDSEHIRVGKLASPATNNPAYYVKTTTSSPPTAVIEGFDGTTTRRFMEFDFDGAQLILGGSGVAVNFFGGGGFVPSSRTISAGTGLTGGGDLTANRTISIDTTVVPRMAVSETITATNWTFSGMIIATNSPGIEVHVSSGSAFYRLARAGFQRYQFGLDVSDNFVVLAYDSSGSFIQTGLSIANTGNDPVSIMVGGALKNLQIDGSGFIKGV